jgi:signal transduction histidine kinase/DNA-binding NarL/FixJ family response regulator
MLAISVAAIGLSAIAGWAFAIPFLKSVLPGAVEMKANTAVGLLLSAIGLFLLSYAHTKGVQRVAQGLAFLVAALGIATFSQYAAGLQLGIDELLFRDITHAYNLLPGRMSPYTAIAFAAIGMALVSFPVARLQPVVSIGAFITLAIGVVSALGYGWNAGELTTDRFLPPVAINTAAAFILLSLGTLLAQRSTAREAKAEGAVERRVLAGFAGALLLIFVAGGYTYRSGADFAASAERVAHTQAVRATLGSVYAAIADAESAQRDYLLTGDLAHKNGYSTRVGEIDGRLDELARLVSDNPEQLRNVAELRRLVSQRIRALSRHVEIFESSSDGLTSVRAAIHSDSGLALIAQIRSLTQQMQGAERALIVQREAAFARTRELNLLALLLTLALASGLFFYLFRSIRREIRIRAQAEAEARQANAAKDHFLATMSHEIRTPLSGMLGMLELLGISKLDAQQRQFLDAARDSGTGLVRIIDDVLDHAKIQAGKLAIRVEPVSIAQVVARVTTTYFAVASAKDLTLKEKVDPRLSPALMADPLRVSQILGNFLSNAIKFTDKGNIEIRVELVERAGGMETVRLSVKDPGIGISAEAQRRMFQPFEQAGVDTSRLYGGTGLGLSISRRLAEMMGGEITMQSEIGRGTTMSLTLTLPVSAAAAVVMTSDSSSRREGAPAPSGQDPLALAVDDHPTNRRLLTGQLNALGLRVQAASGAKEALEFWRAARPSLVITDCNMPEMDGYELARAIRQAESEQSLPRTPIIAWTANVLPSAAAQCHAAGMDDVLTKPADLAKLKETLARWVALPSAGASASQIKQLRGAPVAAPIDWNQLATIAANDAEGVEILEDFLAQTRADLQELEHAIGKQDLAAAARIAHRIKGASRIVGANGLAMVSETMEEAARQAKAQALATAMADMGASVDEVTRYAAAGRATGKAGA